MTAKLSLRWFILVALLLGAAACASVAVARGSHGGHYRYASYGYRGGGHHHGHGHGHYYGHRPYYPAYGYAYAGLPYGYSSVYYGGAPYYYQGGAWYRPYGPRFVVVAPPIGVGIGVLPPYYSTVYYGGAPYYYANQTYYQWYPQRREYVVTRPPANESAEVRNTPSDGDDIFVYPKNGQSEAQQSNDRYECHAWAVQQSGFDPTRQNGGVADSDIDSRRAAYRRAEVACLEGRGYSVR